MKAVLPAGSYVGAYEIYGLIGAGAAGQVYRAFSREIGRPIALKLLSPELAADARARARVRREARAASALQHPGIATVYEVGEHQGRPFIAMALYEGENLEQVLSRGRLAFADAVRIGADLASALAAAHGSGITPTPWIIVDEYG